MTTDYARQVHALTAAVALFLIGPAPEARGQENPAPPVSDGSGVARSSRGPTRVAVDSGIRSGKLSFGARLTLPLIKDFIYTESSFVYLLPEDVGGLYTLHDFRAEQRGGVRYPILRWLSLHGAVGLGASYLFVSVNGTQTTVGSRFSALLTGRVGSTFQFGEHLELGVDLGLSYLTATEDVDLITLGIVALKL